MITYTIEVRAIAEQYDILAQQVARELLQLFDTGGPQGLPDHPDHYHQPPYTLRTAQLYHLTGNLSLPTIEQLTNRLLIDHVTQQATISQTPPTAQAEHIIDVFFYPGVTDTLAESVLTGASMLAITGLYYSISAFVGHKYLSLKLSFS